MNAQTPTLLTETEAADILRLTRTHVIKLARRGVLPVVRLPGDELRFIERDLWTWIESQRQEARPK